ncbi:MAG: M20/M25/M40 family metallo-hydrolase [Phycisphaerae bacterium]
MPDDTHRPMTIQPSVVDFTRQRADSDEYAAYCRNILTELVEIDTAITDDLDRLRTNEAAVFDIIESELRGLLGDNVLIERCPIDPAIADDLFYSKTYYTAAQRGQPLPAEQTYRDRYNLVATLPGRHGSTPGVIYNAHIDTVAPHFGPRAEGRRVIGRGACDAKGQVVLWLAQIKLLQELDERFGLSPPGQQVYHFVIDEETGGNGTLSLVRSGRWAGYEVVVAEATSTVPHPANRGAVWYCCQLRSSGQPQARPLEMMPFVVTRLEQLGQQIRTESNHPLFGPEHVQTNHGVMGCYGKHPSAVNDHIALTISLQTTANPERIQMRIVEIIDAILAEYCRKYGDKTRQIDPATGQPKLAQHYRLGFEPASPPLRYRLDVYGKAGHMGAVQHCDGAITKAAYILRALLKVAQSYPTIQAEGQLADEPARPDPLVLEGAQGFVPTHSLQQICQRMSHAARAAVEEYCQFKKVPFSDRMVQMSFEKLRNEAYASPLDCPGFKGFAAAYRALGLNWPRPSGWQVSCDARIYAHRGHNVVTFGPGSLDQAHSDQESIDVAEIQRALAISTLAALQISPPR